MVPFTDESKLKTCGSNKRLYTRRPTGERMILQCSKPQLNMMVRNIIGSFRSVFVEEKLFYPADVAIPSAHTNSHQVTHVRSPD